jgi:hypothetical protein
MQCFPILNCMFGTPFKDNILYPVQYRTYPIYLMLTVLRRKLFCLAEMKIFMREESTDINIVEQVTKATEKI